MRRKTLLREVFVCESVPVNGHTIGHTIANRGQSCFLTGFRGKAEGPRFLAGRGLFGRVFEADRTQNPRSIARFPIYAQNIYEGGGTGYEFDGSSFLLQLGTLIPTPNIVHLDDQ
jgi:hypothetical protein